jgi:hypothetical protein
MHQPSLASWKICGALTAFPPYRPLLPSCISRVVVILVQCIAQHIVTQQRICHPAMIHDEVL